MKIQAAYRIEHYGETFVATEQELRDAIPQVEAILQAFAIIQDAGGSVDGAEFNIHALDNAHPYISFKLYAAEDAINFLRATNTVLGD